LDESAAAFHEIGSDKSAKAANLSVPLHLDSVLAPTWALMHHAGTFTNVHQDAEGFSVAGQVFGDPADPQPKIWAIMRFRDLSALCHAHEQLAQKMAAVCHYQNVKQEATWHWDDHVWQDCEVDLIYLSPGDML
jgi:hypothetical protein